MKIYYICDCCGQAIDMIEVDQVDEVKFGFNCLTGEERQNLIEVDTLANAMYVTSLCDICIETMDFSGDTSLASKSLLH